MRYNSRMLKNTALYILIVLSFIGTISAQLQWERTSSPVGTTTHTLIAFANNEFILNAGNKLYSSADGVTWKDLGLTLDSEVRNIIYGNRGYVYTCNKGAIRSSAQLTDIKNDTLLPEGDAYHQMAVYGNGIYITGGYSNKTSNPSTGWVFTSSATIPWTQNYLDESIGTLLDAVYNNDMFVAVGAFGGPVVTSQDGITWINRSTEITKIIVELWAIAYGNNRYIATGYMLNGRSGSIVSTDAVTWSIGDTTSRIPYMSIAYGNGYFVVGGGNTNKGICTSIDGIQWTRVPSADSATILSVAFGNDRFIAITRNGTMFTSNTTPSSSQPGAETVSGNNTGSLAIHHDGLHITLPTLMNGQKIAISVTSAIGRQFRIPFVIAASGTITAPIAQLPEGWYHVSVKSKTMTFGMPFIVTR